MTQLSDKRAARRGRIFPEYTISPEELARRQAEDSAFYQRCRAIFDRLQPALINEHSNEFTVIEPDSGDYFTDPDEEIAEQKARQKYPTALLGTFRINRTGACGRL